MNLPVTTAPPQQQPLEEEHHPWCNFWGFVPRSECKSCDRLFEKFPFNRGESEVEAGRRYFPDAIPLAGHSQEEQQPPAECLHMDEEESELYRAWRASQGLEVLEEHLPMSGSDSTRVGAMNMSKTVTLEYCRGTNGGNAIYLNCNESPEIGSGYRIAGPKCWGYIKAVQAFQLDESDLRDLIDQAKQAQRFLKRRKAKGGASC